MLDGSGRQQYALQYKTWQDELWNYFDTVGEFAGVMHWFAAGFSRMHLRAGVWRPELKEPELLEEGSAVEIVNQLVTNAKGGESQYLRTWALHLGIAGVGYFVAEETAIGRVFDVKSADVIKRSGKTFPDRTDPEGRPLAAFDLRVAPDEWRTLDPNISFVTRIFDPDPRYDYLPTSMTKSAITTLREIDLYNRAIIATLLSRIAFNGLLLIPEEVTFPVNPQFKDAPDPFIAELLEFAGRGIRDPGSPGAAIPFPIRVNSQFIEKFKHLLLSSGLDPKIIEARRSAVERLAEQLPAPPEAMSGISDMNHWNAATQTEENIKMYFCPPMEILCGGLTENFLRPMLQAAGKPLRDKEGNLYVVWYDDGDLTREADNSNNAAIAHDRIAITDDAYLAAVGFDEADKPDDNEKRTQILTKLASGGTMLPDSYFLLYPEDRKTVDAMKPTPQTPTDGSAPAVGPSDAQPSVGTTPIQGQP